MTRKWVKWVSATVSVPVLLSQSKCGIGMRVQTIIMHPPSRSVTSKLNGRNFRGHFLGSGESRASGSSNQEIAWPSEDP